MFGKICGCFPGVGKVSFEFLILFMIDWGDLFNDDEFIIELMVSVSKNDGEVFLEPVLAMSCGWIPETTEFVYNNGNKMKIIIETIINFAQIVGTCLVVDIPFNLARYISTTFYLFFLFYLEF